MNKQRSEIKATEWALFQQLKHCIDQDANLDEISKEAYKELFDAAKELFVYHNENNALAHAIKLVEILNWRKQCYTLGG